MIGMLTTMDLRIVIFDDLSTVFGRLDVDDVRTEKRWAPSTEALKLICEPSKKTVKLHC